MSRSAKSYQGHQETISHLVFRKFLRYLHCNNFGSILPLFCKNLSQSRTNRTAQSLSKLSKVLQPHTSLGDASIGIFDVKHRKSFPICDGLTGEVISSALGDLFTAGFKVSKKQILVCHIIQTFSRFNMLGTRTKRVYS